MTPDVTCRPDIDIEIYYLPTFTCCFTLKPGMIFGDVWSLYKFFLEKNTYTLINTQVYTSIKTKFKGQ